MDAGDLLPAGLGTPSDITDGGIWDAATRTITWDLGTVMVDGVVTYDVVVAAGAKGPYENIATIDSDETTPDDDDADTTVEPGGEVLTETSEPTLPPTDGEISSARPAAGWLPGLGLAVVFLVGLSVTAVTTTRRTDRGRRPR